MTSFEDSLRARIDAHPDNASGEHLERTLSVEMSGLGRGWEDRIWRLYASLGGLDVASEVAWLGDSSGHLNVGCRREREVSGRLLKRLAVGWYGIAGHSGRGIHLYGPERGTVDYEWAIITWDADPQQYRLIVTPDTSWPAGST